MSNARLKVLLVPDSVHWVTGTIAKNIARFNPWIEATIASGPVIDQVFAEKPELINNFDLVHFTCPYASKRWLPRFRDLVPCVTSHHHTSDWDLLKHNLDGDAIIVGSPEWAEDLRVRSAEMSKVFCMPYGVDAELFKPPTDSQRAAKRVSLGISPSAKVVGFFGKNTSNEYDRKGIDIFRQALLELNQLLPELAILIVGPGWQELVAQLKSAGIQCLWFSYIRQVTGLASMYHALDFYWVTARVEGGPVTLLEAMSSEVCCLTTSVGLAREIVHDGENALLLPFNNPSNFARSTLALSRNPKKRTLLGRNARRTILENMDVGITTKAVREVYATAFENFSIRQNRALVLDVNQLSKIDQVPTVEQSMTVPLNGFPREIHERVRMLEALAWSEGLFQYHRQKTLALRIILREWLRHPLSPLPLRVLLRRLLPVSLVKRAVRFKNRLAAARLIGYFPTEKF